MSEMQQNRYSPEKWRYTHVDPPKKQEVTVKQSVSAITTHCLFYVFSALCPVGVLVVLYWVCEKAFAGTVFGEPWMQPTVLLVAAYFSGVLIRLGIERHLRSMGLYLIVILGLASYSGICWLDIQQTGSLFSTRFLPETLHLGVMPYVFAIPVVSLLGMLCYRWFTLR